MSGMLKSGTTGNTAGNFILGNILSPEGSYVSPMQAKKSWRPEESGPQTDIWAAILSSGQPKKNQATSPGKGPQMPPNPTNPGMVGRDYMPNFNIY